MKRTICIAQISFQDDIQRHFRRIKETIEQNRKTDLIVFPELILHGHPSTEKPAGILYRRVKNFYQAIARDANDLYSFIRKVDARVIIGQLQGGPYNFWNVATYVDRNTLVHAPKTHIHWTEKNFRAGRKLKVISTPAGNLGLMICFDGAFPEVWRVLALQGAEIIVNISATPGTFPDRYIWRRLQGAAIANQVFVIYVDRPGPYFSGHSAVIDPRGDILYDAGSEECVTSVEIDLSDLYAWREEERIFEHRRPLLYRELGKRSRKAEQMEEEIQPAGRGA